MMRQVDGPERRFWEDAACAALAGILAANTTHMEYPASVVAPIAAHDADALLEQWKQRWDRP